jgi:predicted enzyme involved in methoxymalonyl-ACP biosynthesis
MGRKVEETMVHLAIESARALGATTLEARLLPTKKNKPCLDFWKRSGLEAPEAELFRWSGAAYPLPSCINLDWRRAAP